MKNIWRHFLLATLVSLGITVFLASMYYSNSSGEESLGAHIMSSSALIGFVLSMLLYFTNYVVHLLVEKLLIYTGVVQAHRTYGIQQIAFIGTGVVVSIVFYYIYLSLLLHVFYKVSFSEFYSGSNFTLRGGAVCSSYSVVCAVNRVCFYFLCQVKKPSYTQRAN